MKVKVKTSEIQVAVTKSIKGASNNNLLPLTQLMAISIMKGVLTLKTTDGTNYLYIKQRINIEKETFDEQDVFYAVVSANLFSKLISKISSEFITLEINSGILSIRGNGEYKIELQLDEDGQLVRYPDPVSTDESVFEAKEFEIDYNTVNKILTTCKSSLATTYEDPQYTGYYIQDSIITTDFYRLTCINQKLFGETAVLIRPETMNLLGVMTSDKIKVFIQGDTVCFVSEDCMIYSKVLEGIEDYNITNVLNLLKTTFDCMCKLSKSKLVNILDRLMLFVSPYDNNGVNLKFTDEGLQITSKKANCVELIEYRESSGFTEFECCVDIEMLLSLVKTQISDTIELWYGTANALKLVSGDVTQLISLMD